MGWADLQLIPGLGVDREHRFHPCASSNREFLLLQALPLCLPQAGKMTLLARPLCHSIAADNKSLSVCAAVPQWLYLFADRFSPFTETQIPQAVSPFPRFPQCRNRYLLKDKPKVPFPEASIPFSSPPWELWGCWLWNKTGFEVINLHGGAEGRIPHIL